MSPDDSKAEVKPAMTPEEWEGTSAGDFEDACDLYTLGDMSRHAVAALALYGQPWGFTHRDLAVLDKLIHDAQIEPMLIGGIEFRREADRLRAKLAALLPPREET